MASRSTRNKLRWQVEKAIGHMDRATEHLAIVDIKAEGQSAYIEKHMALLVVMIEGVKEVLQDFRNGL